MYTLVAVFCTIDSGWVCRIQLKDLDQPYADMWIVCAVLRTMGILPYGRPGLLASLGIPVLYHVAGNLYAQNTG